jgi:signal transduction histidine kinase
MIEFPDSNDQIKRFRNKLHDFLGSYRISVGVRLEILAENLKSEDSRYSDDAEDLSSKFRELWADLRLIFLNTEDPEFGERTFRQALAEFIARIGDLGKTKIMSSLDVDIESQPKVAEGFYLIIREAVANAIHHAKPSQISIIIQSVESKLNLTVMDNGAGFDTKRVREGYGIDFIRKVAQSINGELLITSELNKGTTLRVTIPHSQQAETKDDE